MKVAEIFESIHGEINGHHQGRICTFIRFSGCNLKCTYCDTKETQNINSGNNLSITEICREVQILGNKYICITGGEPLIQDKYNMIELLYFLYYNKHYISIETNGTINITPFFRYVGSFVIDYKLEYPNVMYTGNYYSLRKHDVIKFVIQNKDEFYDAFNFWERKLKGKTDAIIAFSPVTSGMADKELIDLLIQNKIENAVFSKQIHKLIDIQ